MNKSSSRVAREIKEALSNIKPVTRDHYVRAGEMKMNVRIDCGKGVAGIIKAATQATAELDAYEKAGNVVIRRGEPEVQNNYGRVFVVIEFSTPRRDR